MAFGTLAWASQRDGRLSLGDRLRMIGQGIAATLRRGNGGGAFSAAESVLAEALRAPPGVLAAWSETLCTQVSPPWLVNHCLRSYTFGVLLAARDGKTLDRELMWLGAMLHDLGLTDAHRAPADTCFAYHGACTAQRLLGDHGAAADRARAVAEAICQHVNIRPVEGAPAEVRYLADATALDTAGMRYRDLAPEVIARVVETYDRAGTRDNVIAVMSERARVERSTRMAMLCRLGFLRRVRSSPFTS